MTTFLTWHPFSFPISDDQIRLIQSENTTWEPLPGMDKAKILGITFLCTLIGSPLGGILGFWTSSYYFRQKRIGQIRDERLRKNNPLHISHSEHDDPSKKKAGKKKKMQDAHFYQKIDRRIIFGVFDGHGKKGGKISKSAKSFFSKYLERNLNKFSSHRRIRKIFQRGIIQFQNSDSAIEEFKSGATCAFGYIDEKTHLLHIATLGDTEVKIVRKNKVLRLSPIKDWSCKKELKRAKKFGDGYFQVRKKRMDVEDLLAMSNDERKKYGKHIRFCKERTEENGKLRRINFSRSLGDLFYDVVSQKAKMTTIPLECGDKIVVGSDGLWDFIEDTNVIDILKSNTINPARDLVNTSLQNQHRRHDNVTAIVMDVS
jgi:serine/threonine protein phosphatase PrpC